MTGAPLGGHYDLVVIGGGIHGAGIARDATLRGLRVALFERDDFAMGASSASSKLVHGGLRYLEQFRLPLVRESLRERKTLMGIAPHLVRTLPFLAPVYRSGRRGRLWMGAGLFLYDLLAAGASLGRHRWLGAEAAVALEPALANDGLRGAFLFYDAQMNDARLCLENVLDAAERGATVRNHLEVVDLVIDAGRVCGVKVRDPNLGEPWEVRAEVVVNATGAWIGEVNNRQDLTARRPPRLSRGTHIVVPPLTRGHALLLSAESDGRVFFVLPYKGMSLIGTTDIEHTAGPDDCEPTEEEIRYLLAEAARHLPSAAPARADVRFAFAGLRALPAEDEADVGRISRRARVREEAPGLLSVLGGKFTTYRAVAERVVDAVESRLDRPVTACTTALTPLPGGDVPPMNDYFQVAEDLLVKKYDHLEIGVLRYLLGTYGSRHLEILRLLDEDPRGAERIEPGLPFTLAEVRHAVQFEMARSLDDVVRRRCYRAYLGAWTGPAHARWEEAFEWAKGTRERPRTEIQGRPR